MSLTSQQIVQDARDYTLFPWSVQAAVQPIHMTKAQGVWFWDGDGAMSNDDQMRSLRLHGQEVIPAVKEIAKELDLKSPFETNDGTGYMPEVWAKAKAEGKV